MLKEIHEQPQSLKAAIAGRLNELTGDVMLNEAVAHGRSDPRPEADHHHRLRHVVPRRDAGQVRHRDRSRRSRSASRSAPRSGTRPATWTRHAHHRHIPVRRDRRYTRRREGRDAAKARMSSRSPTSSAARISREATNTIYTMAGPGDRRRGH